MKPEGTKEKKQRNWKTKNRNHFDEKWTAKVLKTIQHWTEWWRNETDRNLEWKNKSEERSYHTKTSKHTAREKIMISKKKTEIENSVGPANGQQDETKKNKTENSD